MLCCGCNLVRAENKDAFFALGKTLVMAPDTSSITITGIEWRHGNDIAAEWSQGGTPEYYRNFKDRTTLDSTTGVLTISDMTQAEAGTYSVEINSKLLGVTYTARAVDEIKKVEVWVKPKGDDRELDCNSDVTNAGPVTYFWNNGSSWFQAGQKLDIKTNETIQGIKTFSCKISNPVGEKESEPVANPFYKEPSNPALGALAIIPILGVVVVAVVAWQKGWFEKCRSRQKVDTPKDPETGPKEGEHMALREGEGNAPKEGEGDAQ